MTEIDVGGMQQDFFSLFGLPVQQDLDIDQLEARYRQVQRQVHPDKHAHASASEKRLAMQWATHVNEAFQTLKNPLNRARYLLQLAGHELELESNTAMPGAFLMEQMELRENLAAAQEAGNATALDGLLGELRGMVGSEHEALQAALDQQDYSAAALLVRRLMFQEKLQEEIIAALDELEN